MAYKDEILFPATMDGALLPSSRAVPVPDEALDGVAIYLGGRARVHLRTVKRVDSCGHEWIVFDREDGKEWDAIDDSEICGGVGAYRKTDGPVSSLSPHEYPRGYRNAVRRCDQGTLDLVPIKWLCDLLGPQYGGQRFREYLPAEDFVGRPISGFGTREEIAAELEEVLDGNFPEFTCELGDDWQFKTIEAEAIYMPAYRFKAREIKNQAHHLALIAHALEEILSKHHPALSPEAVAAFWTSWSVWNHLWKWSVKISDELNRRRVPSDDAIHNTYALQHETWSFGRMVLANSATGVARGIPPVGDQAKVKPLWARNLRALQRASKLSNRKLARKIGPAGDHKAVAGHCAGTRVPEDRTLAEYAQFFSRCLHLDITADQIRNEDLTERLTDSIT